MKKLLALLLVLAMVTSMAFVFTACDNNTGDTGDQGGGSGSVDGGDTGDQGGDSGNQGGEGDEDFNHDFKDSGVGVAGPESEAAKESDDSYLHNGK
jgi:hypothetical protein